MDSLPRMTVDNKPIKTDAAHVPEAQETQHNELGLVSTYKGYTVGYMNAYGNKGYVCTVYQNGEPAMKFRNGTMRSCETNAILWIDRQPIKPPAQASPEPAEDSPLVTAAQANVVFAATEYIKETRKENWAQSESVYWLGVLENAVDALAAIKPPATGDTAAAEGSAR